MDYRDRSKDLEIWSNGKSGENKLDWRKKNSDKNKEKQNTLIYNPKEKENLIGPIMRGK